MFRVGVGGCSLRFDIKSWKEWEIKDRAAERELSTVTSRYIGGSFLQGSTVWFLWSHSTGQQDPQAWVCLLQRYVMWNSWMQKWHSDYLKRTRTSQLGWMLPTRWLCTHSINTWRAGCVGSTGARQSRGLWVALTYKNVILDIVICQNALLDAHLSEGTERSQKHNWQGPQSSFECIPKHVQGVRMFYRLQWQQ